MGLHIKALTKVIETQNDLASRLLWSLNGMDRQIALMQYKIGKLEGKRTIKDSE